MDLYNPSRGSLNSHEVKLQFQRGRHKSIVFGTIISDGLGAEVLAELTMPAELGGDFEYTLLSFCDERNKDTLRPIVDGESKEVIGVNLLLADGKGTKMTISEDHDAYLVGAVISAVRPATREEVEAWNAAAEDGDESEEDEDESDEESSDEDSGGFQNDEEGPSEEELRAEEEEAPKVERKPRKK